MHIEAAICLPQRRRRQLGEALEESGAKNSYMFAKKVYPKFEKGIHLGQIN
jgi:hypothetical protein